MNNIEIKIMGICFETYRNVHEILKILRNLGMDYSYFYISHVLSVMSKRDLLYRKKRWKREVYYQTTDYGKEVLLHGNEKINIVRKTDHNNDNRQLSVSQYVKP